MRQPLRIEMCRLLLDGKARTQNDFFAELSPIYGREKQLLALDNHLQSLRCVGIISVDKEWVEKKNGAEALVQSWVISPSGRKRLDKVLRT